MVGKVSKDSRDRICETGLRAPPPEPDWRDSELKCPSDVPTYDCGAHCCLAEEGTWILKVCKLMADLNFM